jgi:hypothetical protein
MSRRLIHHRGMTDDTENGSNSPRPIGVREFLIEYGLYRSVRVDGLNEDLEDDLRENEIKFDAYCPGCGQSSIFHKSASAKPTPSLRGGVLVPAPKAAAFQAYLRCARAGHVLIFYLRCADDQLMKVGQIPSYADLLVGELGDDAKVLDPPDRRELVKAHRLFSSDAAVGGFVYLRRVFERLIERVRAEAESAGESFEGWREQRMGERIAALSSHLPRAVVANAGVWTILSAGIHALTEEDCKRYFPVLRAALVQILHQEAAQRQRSTDEADMKKAVGSILGEITQTASSPAKDAD